MQEIEDRKKRIRYLLWTYFILLMIEGTLRKWFLPFLSTPLLLIRDPIAVMAIFWGWPMLTKSIHWLRVKILMYIGAISIVLAIYVGHGDWFTALYGLRIYWIQIPLIFIFPLVFNKNDVIRICWVILILSIPMVILLAAQSSTPPSHILNVGPGGTGSSAFSGAGGKFRPSAAFSFTNSVTTFFTLATGSLMAIIYGMPKMREEKGKQESENIWVKSIKRLAIFLGITASIIALPVSISRGLMANYAIVLICTVVTLLVTRSNIKSLLIGLGIVIIISNLALNIPIVKEASMAFALRWELAAGVDRESEGDAAVVEHQLKSRVLHGYLEPIEERDKYSLLGRGIGLGSNIGAVRLSGKKQFLSSEGSWAKTMDEKGLFLGTAFLLWRISTAMMMVKKAINIALIKQNKIPLILTSISMSMILNSQLGQSSGLGFIVLTTGLTFASMKE